MGVSRVKWRCPKCSVDVGESMGELKNHTKKVHGEKPETRIAAA